MKCDIKKHWKYKKNCKMRLARKEKYIYNDNDMTCSIERPHDGAISWFIPRCIRHGSKDYTLTNICKFCFTNRILERIEFAEDSAIKEISKNSFSSRLKKLIISPSIVLLEDGWCMNTSRLNNVVLLPNNQSYAYLDDDHKIILGKTNVNEDKFDSIVFACRNIKQMTIPSFITVICPYSFENCKLLQSIEFESNSNLIKIGENAFSNISIDSLSIPDSVTDFGGSIFNKSEIRHLIIPSQVKNSNAIEFLADEFTFNDDFVYDVSITCFPNANKIIISKESAFCDYSVIFTKSNIELIKDNH